MKKRIMSLAIVFIMVMIPVFSDKFETRGLNVVGTLGKVHSISVVANNDAMPIDLESDVIKQSPGILIASWAMTTNYRPVTVTVVAEHLQSDALIDGRRVEIPYHLKFGYEYPLWISDEDYDLIIDSEDISSVEPGTAPEEVGSDQKIYFGKDDSGFQGIEILSTSNSTISFYLDSNVAGEISDDSKYPVGDYFATVTLILENNG